MIISADRHLRLTPPKSRIDDFFSAQERKFRFTLELAKTSPPLVEAGDFFDLAQQPKGHEGLLEWVISLLREYKVPVLVTPGQHDLPGHSIQQIKNSSLGVLAAAGVIHILEEFIQPVILTTGSEIIWGCAYGQEPHPSMNDNQRLNVLLWHHMVTRDTLWPGQEVVQPGRLLRLYPLFDLICTGDNHQTIVQEQHGRFLINPGSTMRQTAAQVDHKPCVFKWEQGKLEQIFLPIEDNVLDLTELEQTKERDSRISAFVERLNTQHEIGLDFQKNLDEHLRINVVKPEVKKIIWECVE
jgi:DNA repair exonuclease SbcCD nuclease subunit